MRDPSLRELLGVAVDAAYLAGRHTLAYFNAGVAVATKPDDTPVTIADRQAEQILRDVIGRHFPTHAIIGEEHGHTAGDPNFAWYLDPIDGTKSFIHGIPLYSVLVGLEIRGRVEVGVIYLPALDEMLAAASGEGCWWNGRRARVSSVSTLGESLLLCTDMKAARARSDAYDRLESATKLQRCAFDAWGYALVATGRAEVVIDPVMSAWDCGPLPVILRESGGRFGDWRGQETIHSGEAFAANAAVFPQALDILRSEVKRGG